MYLIEMGSHYTNESGVYMSSFAATVFVAALVTIGVLMVTLLVALTVMLNSCQSRGPRGIGVIELFKTSDERDYCNAFAFHAELNNLKANEFPTICKRYSNVDQFLGNLNLTVQLAENYFSTLKPNDDGLDVILRDVDDIFLPDIISCSNSARDCMKHVEHEHPACKLVLRLHLKLQASGWSLVLFQEGTLSTGMSLPKALFRLRWMVFPDHELDDVIDLVIPRGSNKLVSQIKESTKIPALGHAGHFLSTRTSSRPVDLRT